MKEMKARKYVVSWHEGNGSGNPANVMGAEMFDTRKKAQELTGNRG